MMVTTFLSLIAAMGCKAGQRGLAVRWKVVRINFRQDRYANAGERAKTTIQVTLTFPRNGTNPDILDTLALRF